MVLIPAKYRRRLTQFTSHKWRLAFAVIFGGIGLLFVLATSAATYVKSTEAEDGVINGNAASVSDTTASNGVAVRFGAGPPAPPPAGSTASSVSQYGITWSFDKAYPVGKFANGDWWVIGPVTLTAISPNFTGSQNGWEANPSSGDLQGLDSRLEGFRANLVPTLPYVAAAGKSIIKAVSRPGACGNDGQNHYPCLTTATVLTVLASAPPDNGQSSFRPPFFGTAKPIFSTTQLKLDQLPSKAPVAGAPSLASIARRYQRVQLDYGNTWYGRYMHASENYTDRDNPSNDNVSEYGSEIGIDTAVAALRLMLNDSTSAKMPALINYVQAGIDIYGMHKGGVEWTSDGGHFMGRKLPAVFAAVLLDDPAMKTEIATAQYATYGDDGHAYVTANSKTVAAMQARGYAPVLYGKPCDNGEYERQQREDVGPRDCRDPLGMIDGGEAPGDSYQSCCVSQPLKGASLAARLLPGGKAVWNYNPTHDYIDRWVGFGAWGAPDDWSSLGRLPDRNYTGRHGTGKDGGFYGSTFVNNMWNSYRNGAE